MKSFCIFFTCALSGCAQYTAVQMNLLEQARKGIAITQKSLADKSQLIEQYEKQQRKRLDEAFDADVREHSNLSSDWVIEHRRAYAAAIDGFAAQQIASRDSAVIDQKNLQSIDDALQRVIWLESIELKLVQLPQEIKP